MARVQRAREEEEEGEEDEEEEKDACGVRMELSWAAAPGSLRPQQRSWSGEGERQKAEGRRERNRRGEEGRSLQGVGSALALRAPICTGGVAAKPTYEDSQETPTPNMVFLGNASLAPLNPGSRARL